MAIIKYETADGPVEYNVSGTDIEYEAETDHWRVKAGKENGRDVYEIIPRERVYSVKMIGVKKGKQLTRTK